MDRYEVGEDLSSGDSRATVSRARKRDSGLNVVLKSQYHENIAGINSVFTEMINQQSIGHRAVCTIYDCILAERDQQKMTTLVLESLSTDLQREIDRRVPNDHFAESILWGYLRELVDALSCAQQRGISHRDIKPENLLLTADGNIKIGDFDSSKQVISQEEMLHSVRGTPIYHSPLLREAFIRELQNFTGNPVRHNVFKSDVFSLGVTMLVAARLGYPRELMFFQGLQGKIARAISEIQYSPQFQEVLRRMMEFEESARPDFIALQAMLLREYSATPPKCDSCPKSTRWKNGGWVCEDSH